MASLFVMGNNTWIYIHLHTRWMVSLSWWSHLIAIMAQFGLGLFPYFHALSSITDVSVLHSHEEARLKTPSLCALQLKVLREHQVNIHWLTLTARNLINMSSGCFLGVSSNTLPTHTPTRMNKAQTHTHMHTTQANMHETHTHTHMHAT